jgi:hypothetical protein
MRDRRTTVVNRVNWSRFEPSSISVAPSGRFVAGQLPRAKALGYSVLPFHGKMRFALQNARSPFRRFAVSPHRPFADTLPTLRFVLFRYLRRHQLRGGPIRRGLVLEDAMVQIFAVTGPQRLGLD